MRGSKWVWVVAGLALALQARGDFVLRWATDVDMAVAGASGVVGIVGSPAFDGAGGAAFVMQRSTPTAEFFQVAWIAAEGQLVHRSSQFAGGDVRVVVVTPTRLVYVRDDRIVYEARLVNGAVVTEALTLAGGEVVPELATAPTTTQGVLTVQAPAVDTLRVRFYEFSGEGDEVAIASVGWEAGNLRVRWATQSGAVYRLQLSSDRVTWVDAGVPVLGTGAAAEIVVPISSVATSIRVVRVG